MAGDREKRLGCDGCTLCCELLHVEEIAKPAGQLCPHVLDGGCSLHPTRGGTEQPQSCHLFYCSWLASQQLDGPDRMPPSMRPDRSHVVFGPCDEKVKNRLHVNVDTRHPDAWMNSEVNEWMARIVANGNEIILWVGDHAATLKVGRRTVRSQPCST